METQAAHLSFIALSPLVGAILAFVIGSKQKALAGWIATAASALSFLWVLKLVLGLPEGTSLEETLFPWISAGEFSADFVFRLDRLSAVMCLVVTGIGSLIHLYSIAYMAEDESPHRFFAYLNLFMFSMLTLVLGGNLLVLFVGWEGVGLCSYLLIGFWFKNLAFAAAGRKAFVVNRIGDAGFLIGMFYLARQFGTLDFLQLADAVKADPGMIGFYTVVSLCLFVGATGKSAQIPLFVWLPDAMAGPTPVSALIHAATMVTAGVYMLARMNFVFTLAPAALAVVTLIALLTAFVAATTALCQNDIKKVLAYSTVSQLGFMFLAAGAGAYGVAIFHVVTHAFFKACLFLGAGSVIHGCHHEQDMRHMGGLKKYMPITFATYAISTLAIAGIYPFAGFQSKHAILAALAHSANPYLSDYNTWIVGVATFTAFLTAFYMTRSVAMTFLGEYRGHAHPHESPWAMTTPLVVLSILAIGGGLYLQGTLGEYMSAVVPFGVEHHEESIGASIIGSWVGILGVVLGLVLYTELKKVPGQIFSTFKGLGELFSHKYYVDELYGALIIRPLENLARMLWKGFDQGVIDGAVNGTGAMVEVSGEMLRFSQTGQVRHYALGIFLATMFIVVFYLVM